MLYMIVERFRGGDALPVYRRFRDQGRLAPKGLRYVESWVSADLGRCFQIMECDDPRLLEEWAARWEDLTEFEILPVITSAEAAAAVAPRLLDQSHDVRPHVARSPPSRTPPASEKDAVVAMTAEYDFDEKLSATIETAPDERDLLSIEQGLVRHAMDSGIEARNHAPLTVILRHAERGTVGGLVGTTVWGWLQVKQLWIADELRRQGLGRRLLLIAEAEAANRGCHHSMLDTFDFQALPFYEKLGYELFGRLDDFPRGHARYFVSKALAV